MDRVNKYEMTYDLHTHTIFSHGKGTIEDNVKAALQKGLKTIGIADHGSGHVLYGVKKNSFSLMRKEIDRLKVIYPQVEILLGVEANIMDPDGSLDISEMEKLDLDYILAGYHYGVFGRAPVRALGSHISNFLKLGLSRNANTDRVIAALFENKIRILTHPGDKGPVDIFSIAEACAKTGTLMEISTWHDHLTVEEIRICAKTNANFVISSDAHTPEKVADFEKGLERAFAAGLDPKRIDNIKLIDEI